MALTPTRSAAALAASIALLGCAGSGAPRPVAGPRALPTLDAAVATAQDATPDPVATATAPAVEATAPPTPVASPEAPAVPPPATAAEAANRFGFDLYSRLRAAPGNLVYSSASAAIVLSMTAAGARGDTRSEMDRVLHRDALAEVDAAFGKLLSAVNERARKTRTLELRAADRIWAQLSVALKADFVGLAQARYGASVGRIDFGNAAKATEAIDGWVSLQTNGKIPELLTPNDVADGTLVLVNALYFHGRWSRPFQRRLSATAKFRTGGGEVDALYMTQRALFAYNQCDGAHALDLPYQGGVSMVVLLPNADDGIAAIEEHLAATYDECVSGLRPADVDVKLPRWKAASEKMTFKGPLMDMGMHLAFLEGADFSGISEPSLHVSDVIQKAVIDVTEMGTEAAAATAVVMSVKSERIDPFPPIAFHADHPFLYFLRDDATGLILFAGRVTRPE